jgi:hypothetical protein
MKGVRKMNKQEAIKFLEENGAGTEKLNTIKDTDIVDISKDVNIQSKTFGKFLVTVTSENYNSLKELSGEKQAEGEYTYNFMI